MGLMKVHIEGIYPDSLEEVALPGKSFARRVPRQRQHMPPTLKKTARTISFSGADPVATITSVQGTRAGGKHLVDIFFHGPRLVHPPTGHLPDDRVHPLEFFYFLLNIVPVVNHSFSHLMTECR